MPDCGAILLAAGIGRRFGADKRLQEIDGRKIAQITTATYLSAFAHVRVVVRHVSDPLHDLLTNVEMVVAPDAELGMGHSLRRGIQDVPWRYAFVGLMDMPWLQVATLQMLIARAKSQGWSRIIRPRLQTTEATNAASPPWGHPIGFPHELFGAMQLLQGDAGARQLLRSHQHLVTEVSTADPGVIKDIDTPADLLEQPT
ncbi:MAG: nucleotidyltransferase family protein [Pseudomonadota bacterium]